MADAHKNFAKGTLTNSPGTAGTSFVLGSGEGALFAANMPVTIVPASTQPDSTNAEIGYVTAVASDTLTVTRAQQSTTAKNAVAGWVVLGTITAKALTDIETDVTAAKARANHTGTQTAATISDFNTAADARITAATGVSVQAYDADLSAVAGLSSNGSIHRTGAGTAAVRTLTGTTNVITVTNGDGVSGNPTINAGTNVVQLTATQTLTNKTLTAPRIANGGFIADANGNELIVGSTTASAVNEITVMNNTTANNPSITATGGDSNISLELGGKGTGGVAVRNSGLIVYGNASTPATPPSNAGKIWMSGSSNSRPKFMNGSGADETIITDGGPEWTTWTPTWTNVSGGTLNYAKYQQVGKTVNFRVKYTLAGAGVTGAMTFSPPVAVSSDYAANDSIAGSAALVDTGVARYPAQMSAQASTAIEIRPINAGGTYGVLTATSGTVPFTWGSTDIISAYGSYEAA